MITGFKVVPCPYCGADVRLLHLHQQDEMPRFVRCGKCGARGPTADTAEEAVIMWNERPDGVACSACSKEGK